MAEETITIVSGLPRSGTSMMMQMLEAGGIPALRDDIRQPDEDNPKGYYEFERVKQIDQDQGWLEDAKGKVVKMVSALLPRLPAGFTYKVIFMRREISEILASQKIMLNRRNQTTSEVEDAKMAVFFQNHLKQIQDWLGKQNNIAVLYVIYNDVMENPQREIKRIDEFLSRGLDTTKMAGVVDRALYRERRSTPAG